MQAELMKRYKDSQTCSLKVDRMTTFKISTLDGIRHHYSDVILEGLYKSKYQDSAQLQTVWALYDQGTVRNGGHPSFTRLKRAVKLHIDQMTITRNFKVWRDVVERGSVFKSQNGKKAYVERKEGECFSVEGTWTMFQRDPCSFSHDTMVSGNSGPGQRRKGRSSFLASNSEAKTDEGGEKSSKTSGNIKESSKKSEIPCRFRICKNPSCAFWHLPCVRITSLKKDVYIYIWRQMSFPTC